MNVKGAVAIAKLSIGGNVLNAEVLAGYDRAGIPFNPDASIGTIEVEGNWNASSVVAGVTDTTGDGFGRNDGLIAGDTTPGLFARIASITLKGIATGSGESTTDHFGITAQQIGRMLAGSTPFPSIAGANDLLLDSLNSDFRAVDFA